MSKFLIPLAILFWTSEAGALLSDSEPPAEVLPQEEPPIPGVECPGDHTCVAPEDMALLMQLAHERLCLDETPPTFEVDGVTIVIDKDRRVFYQSETGGPASDYVLKMHWCHYDITAKGKLNVVAALKEPPIWGFRFRPKAYMGYMILAPFFDGNDFSSGVDAGLMLDFLYYRWVNLNVAVGFRTVGVGVGVDITQNFGLYAGYGIAWEAMFNPLSQPLHNPVLGFDFAF